MKDVINGFELSHFAMQESILHSTFEPPAIALLIYRNIRT